MNALAGPVETRTISHLHPRGSFAVADHPRPHGREEIWRFTPLSRIEALLDDAPTAAARVEVEAPAGLAAAPLRPGEGPRGQVLIPVDRAAALASQQTPAAVHIRIPPEAGVAAPIRLSITADEPDALVSTHIVIDAKPHSRATVLLRHTGSARLLGNVEILVGDGAELTVVTVQDWDHTAQHLGQHEARVGRDARFRHIAVSLGGDLIRLQTNVSYAGPGGQADLFGVYFADAGQHIEHRLFVDHNHPKGTSLV
ncbi:MAG: SufD family Fe-S cluster assembly protein, partial [Propionibacteriaceae bacterium]|nr:SufD family Fe-S cluster assembly protein [Propionibacteriaceae bacterium]